MYRNVTAAAVIAALASPAALHAQDSEIESLRNQVRQLEERLDQLESKPAAPSAATAEFGTKPILSDNAFNPAISLILDGKYRNLQRDPRTYHIGGFVPGGEEVGPGDRGFGLDESELTLSANIDPYFSGYFTAAFTPDETVEVEEAYIQNSGFFPGTTIKFGRFFNAFGYQNEQHAHAWDFVDTPLIHQAFLGGQLKDDGIQIRYVAPTALFIEIGVEGSRGSNFPGSDRNKNGFNASSVFAHAGGDIGFSNSYRFGASYRKTTAAERAYEDFNAAGAAITNTFTGDVKMWGLDLVWKWAPQGDPGIRNFRFQAEYFRRREDGRLAFVSAGAGLSGGYRSTQSGWYTQSVYQFARRWRIGARYEELDRGDVDIGLVGNGTLSADNFPLLADHRPKRLSAMIDFSPTEFSRLRLQYARDEARFSDPDNQFFVQYIMSLGAHGAHKF